MSQDQKFFSQLGLRFFIGTLIIYGIQYLISFGMAKLFPGYYPSASVSLVLATLPMYCLGIPALYLLIRKMPHQAPRRTLEWHLPDYLRLFAMGYALIIVTNLLGTGFGQLLERTFSQVSDTAVNDAQILALNSNLPVILIFMVILGPIIEEVVFRKLVVDRTIRYGEGVAVLLSGLIFGLFHGNLSQFCYAFALGAFFAYIYCKTGDIRITCVMHMIVNFLGGVVAVQVLKGLPMDAFNAASSEADMATMVQLVSENMRGWAIMVGYELFIAALTIGGIVFWVLRFRKISFAAGEITIPDGKRFVTVICNPGMILFILFFAAVIVADMTIF